MVVEIKNSEGSGIVKISGEINKIDLTELEEAVEKVSRMDKIVFDLGSVRFISSAFINLMFGLRKRNPKLAEKLEFINSKDDFDELFTITHFDKFFRII
ncbi:MAG: STAS domain-containing protein [Fibrobacterota bacterium]